MQMQCLNVHTIEVRVRVSLFQEVVLDGVHGHGDAAHDLQPGGEKRGSMEHDTRSVAKAARNIVILTTPHSSTSTPYATSSENEQLYRKLPTSSVRTDTSQGPQECG
jgi:hypothetical protein